MTTVSVLETKRLKDIPIINGDFPRGWRKRYYGDCYKTRGYYLLLYVESQHNNKSILNFYVTDFTSHRQCTTEEQSDERSHATNLFNLKRSQVLKLIVHRDKLGDISESYQHAHPSCKLDLVKTFYDSFETHFFIEEELIIFGVTTKWRTYGGVLEPYTYDFEVVNYEELLDDDRLVVEDLYKNILKYTNFVNKRDIEIQENEEEEEIEEEEEEMEKEKRKKLIKKIIPKKFWQPQNSSAHEKSSLLLPPGKLPGIKVTHGKGSKIGGVSGVCEASEASESEIQDSVGIEEYRNPRRLSNETPVLTRKTTSKNIVDHDRSQRGFVNRSADNYDDESIDDSEELVNGNKFALPHAQLNLSSLNNSNAIPCTQTVGCEPMQQKKQRFNHSKPRQSLKPGFYSIRDLNSRKISTNEKCDNFDRSKVFPTTCRIIGTRPSDWLLLCGVPFSHRIEDDESYPQPMLFDMEIVLVDVDANLEEIDRRDMLSIYLNTSQVLKFLKVPEVKDAYYTMEKLQKKRKLSSKVNAGEVVDLELFKVKKMVFDRKERLVWTCNHIQ